MKIRNDFLFSTASFGFDKCVDNQKFCIIREIFRKIVPFFVGGYGLRRFFKSFCTDSFGFLWISLSEMLGKLRFSPSG